jgi:hypothetical protein
MLALRLDPQPPTPQGTLPSSQTTAKTLDFHRYILFSPRENAIAKEPGLELS